MSNGYTPLNSNLPAHLLPNKQARPDSTLRKLREGCAIPDPRPKLTQQTIFPSLAGVLELLA